MMPDLPFAQLMRLIWIDATLSSTGKINRADICAAFWISAAQAALDLRAFKDAFPDRMTYDRVAKTYRRQPASAPGFPVGVRFAVVTTVRQIGEGRTCAS